MNAPTARHQRHRDGERSYTCEQPERLPDDSTTFAGECRACVIAAIAHLGRNDDEVGETWNSAEPGDTRVQSLRRWVRDWAPDHGLVAL